MGLFKDIKNYINRKNLKDEDDSYKNEDAELDSRYMQDPDEKSG